MQVHFGPKFYRVSGSCHYNCVTVPSIMYYHRLVLRFKKIGDNEARMLGDVIKENTSLSKVE